MKDFTFFKQFSKKNELHWEMNVFEEFCILANFYNFCVIYNLV